MSKITVPILAIVPARGDSRGIKHKNIIDLAGKPLIAYTLEAMSGSRYYFDHILSTDSKQIRQVAMRYEANVPFLRPRRLATNQANVVAVVENILKKIKKEYLYILLLQPTAPLRLSSDIDQAITLAIENDADSVCSFTQVDSHHPWLMHKQQNSRLMPLFRFPAGLPRQKFPPVLLRNGAIYLTKVRSFLKEKSFITKFCLPYLMPVSRSVNINTWEDLALAEFYLMKRRVHAGKAI